MLTVAQPAAPNAADANELRLLLGLAEALQEASAAVRAMQDERLKDPRKQEHYYVPTLHKCKTREQGNILNLDFTFKKYWGAYTFDFSLPIFTDLPMRPMQHAAIDRSEGR